MAQIYRVFSELVYVYAKRDSKQRVGLSLEIFRCLRVTCELQYFVLFLSLNKRRRIHSLSH